MHRDALVEIDGVVERAEFGLARARRALVEGEDSRRRHRLAADADFQRLAERNLLGTVVAFFADVDRDLFAPRLAVTARHVRHERRSAAEKRDDHLLGQVDLCVAGSVGLAARQNSHLVAHHVPHRGGHDTGGLGARRLQHELFERPHRLHGGAPEHAVDRARRELQLGESRLQHAHVFTVDAFFQIARDRRQHRGDGVLRGGSRRHAGRRLVGRALLEHSGEHDHHDHHDRARHHEHAPLTLR